MINNKTYDILKWMVWLFLPGLTTFVGVVGQTLGWSNVDTIVTIMTAFTTFLGMITGLSNKNYNEDKSK